ncbi:MAG: DUF3137 domain-containing protein, partial [Chitinophagales bacterium]
MNNNTFDTLYNSKLKPALSELQRGHRLVLITGIFTRLMEIYFLAAIISLFLGFLNMFAITDFATSGFVVVIKWFMYAVLGIIVVAIVNKQVKVRLGERNPALVKDNLLVNGLTLIIAIIVLALAWFAGTNFLGDEFNSSFFIKWAGTIFSVFLLIIPYNLLKRVESRYNNSYKSLLITKSLPLIAGDTVYSENEFLPVDEFIKSKLFTFQSIYDYKGSDLLNRREHNFHGSKLKVIQKEVHQSSGKSETKFTEIFNGFLFVADFNKKFQGETYVFPDISRSVFGEIYGESLNEHFHRPQLQLIKLEDPEFEKMFAVYSTDAVEARYILSTKLVERITALKNVFYQDMS